MKYNEKEKDEALTAYYNDSCCDDGDLVAMLKADGYLVTLTSPNGIVTRITDKGRAFCLNGGYSGAKEAREKESRDEFKRKIITAVIGSLSGSIFGFLAGILANYLNIGG